MCAWIRCSGGSKPEQRINVSQNFYASSGSSTTVTLGTSVSGHLTLTVRAAWTAALATTSYLNGAYISAGGNTYQLTDWTVVDAYTVTKTIDITVPANSNVSVYIPSNTSYSSGVSISGNISGLI